MLRRPQYRDAARDGRTRVLQLRRRIGGAAGFAVVTILVSGTAFRALAFDEAVGQEHALFFVVILFDFTHLDEAGVTQIAVDGFGALAVFIAVRRVIQIEGDVETGEVT